MSKTEKRQRQVMLKFAFLRMRHYLKENGVSSNGLKNRRIAEIFADMALSERIEINLHEWVLQKIDEGAFIGMKTGRKARIAKRKDIPVPLVERTKYPVFLKSDYWRYVRKLAIDRDGKKCTRCNEKKYLHAHHLTYNNHFNEHNHLEDLITLCKDCHKIEHKRLDSVKDNLAEKYNLPVKNLNRFLNSY